MKEERDREREGGEVILEKFLNSLSVLIIRSLCTIMSVTCA